METAHGFEEFVAIVEHGSVTAAAVELGIPRPTLSRRLARLEDRLGVRLLHRTTRRSALTAQGEVLYERARRVVLAAREAEREVRRLDGVPRGLLRVSVPTEIPQTGMAMWVAEFLELHPEVQLELVATSAHVDLVGEGFDIALRAGPVEDKSLVVKTLARNVRIAVASPRYLAQHGTPLTPAGLAGHRCILGFRHGTAPDTTWPLLAGGSVRVSGPLMTNQMGMRLQAARQHIGIAMVVERMVKQELQSGELVHVLAGIVGREERAGLAYPSRAHLDPKVRAFVDHLSSRIEASRAARRA